MACLLDCFSDYLRDKINDHILGGPTWTPPSTVYAALMTVMCTAAGGGTEATGGSYARVSLANNSANWPASTGQVKQNGTGITWPTPTASWGTVVGLAFYDASTGGNLLIFGGAPSFVAIITQTGQDVVIDPGGISLGWAA